MRKRFDSLRRAAATFVFATTGNLLGVALTDWGAGQFWLLTLFAGLGALVNFAYRWSERELKRTAYLEDEVEDGE